LCIIVIACDWDCNKGITDPNCVLSGVTRHNIEIASDAMKHMLSFIKIGSGFQEIFRFLLNNLGRFNIGIIDGKDL
jgi:hypothetical protein